MEAFCASNNFLLTRRSQLSVYISLITLLSIGCDVRPEALTFLCTLLTLLFLFFSLSLDRSIHILPCSISVSYFHITIFNIRCFQISFLFFTSAEVSSSYDAFRFFRPFSSLGKNSRIQESVGDCRLEWIEVARICMLHNSSSYLEESTCSKACGGTSRLVRSLVSIEDDLTSLDFLQSVVNDLS